MLETEAFSISRDLKAPRALVYEVQTDAKHLANWLSPEGFKTIHAAMDFRVGGRYHYGLEGPDGMQMWGLQRFREIVPNEKIVLIQSFSDKDGGLARHPLSPEWPLEMLSTTTFEEIGPRMTRITISWRPYNSDEAGMQGVRSGTRQHDRRLRRRVHETRGVSGATSGLIEAAGTALRLKRPSARPASPRRKLMSTSPACCLATLPFSKAIRVGMPRMP